MRGNLKIKRPIDAFSKCPACFGQVLRHVGIHVFCKFCGWDSIQAYSDAGGYDQIQGAEIFNRRSLR